MFGRYALPSDDLLTDPDVIVTASAEDPDYLAENITGRSTSGHFNLPSRPAKLTTDVGWWKFDFGAAVTARAAAVIYHNLDAGVQLILQGNTVDNFTAPPFQQQFTIPAHHEDGWPISPWMEFASAQSYRWWLLVVDSPGSPPNSLDLQVGRFMLLSQLREMDSDVRWGVVEEEEHGLIEQPTELGVETVYDLGGKRRSFAGEMRYRDTEANSLLTLYRTARSRIQPWLLIPDEDVNDAWLVRFEENRWSRTRQVPNVNDFPFRVKELSRGLPWP